MSKEITNYADLQGYFFIAQVGGVERGGEEGKKVAGGEEKGLFSPSRFFLPLPLPFLCLPRRLTYLLRASCPTIINFTRFPFLFV